MELQNAKKDENEKASKTSVVENDEDAGKDGEVVVEAQKDENEVVETFAGEKSREDEKFVETFMDVKPEEAVLVEENQTVKGIVEESSVLASVEACSSGVKKPQGLRPKTKIVKKVKRLVKRKNIKGTAVQMAGEENVTVEQGVKDGITVVNIKKDEQSAEPSQGRDKESATILQGPNEGVDMESIVSDKSDARASSGGLNAEKGIEGSVEAPENVLSVEKKQPRKLKAKAKLRKISAALLVKTKVDNGTPKLEQTNQENNNSLDVNEQHNGVEKLNSLAVNSSEGDQQKTIAERNKQNQLTDNKIGLAQNKRHKKKRKGKQVLGSNKKQNKGKVAAADVTQQKVEERNDHLVNPEKREKDGHGKEKIGGLIFMCNTKTRPDCFRFNVMGVQEKRKDYVMGIKPGLKLFLYDYDLKLLYGIFQASSAGGLKLERNAFGGSFPAQVRFKVFSDCLPLPESQFKKAMKENYNNKNKFKTELTHEQVLKLKKLFRPAPLPAQLTHTQPVLVPRDADRIRTDKDHHAPGSSRTHLTRTHERLHNASAPPRREEPPRDLYLSEREYRTYGLRRAEPSQQYPIPPPDSSYPRGLVPLESYHPSVDHDRLLRHAESERHDRSREFRPLHVPESDYHPYDHLSSRREILARHSPNQPASAVALESYRRDPYSNYDYRAPERPPRTYLASSREGDDLYSRYVTADALAEYYRSSSRRYPNMAESELLPSSMTSRYAYSGSLPYSHR